MTVTRPLRIRPARTRDVFTAVRSSYRPSVCLECGHDGVHCTLFRTIACKCSHAPTDASLVEPGEEGPRLLLVLAIFGRPVCAERRVDDALQFRARLAGALLVQQQFGQKVA